MRFVYVAFVVAPNNAVAFLARTGFASPLAPLTTVAVVVLCVAWQLSITDAVSCFAVSIFSDVNLRRLAFLYFFIFYTRVDSFKSTFCNGWQKLLHSV